jgi:glycosyltransferase involved in cell wall biosynthesis
VSVSFCVQRKRIDKIVDAIRLACQSGPGVNFVWTHIGDGPLRAQLERLAVEQLGSLPNVTFKFAGAMPNQSVLAFYSSEPVDIFINCSESEGVPVSIMEAMSCGIPAIAPAVGGIPELVDNKCGMLVPEGAPSEETVAGMCRLAGGNRERYRIAARQRIVHAYCANTNFNKFIASIKAIAVVPGGSSSISAVNTMSGMQG